MIWEFLIVLTALTILKMLMIFIRMIRVVRTIRTIFKKYYKKGLALVPPAGYMGEGPVM